MCCTLAAHFDASDQGKIAGLFHDLGKAEDNFQCRINGGAIKGVKLCTLQVF